MTAWGISGGGRVRHSSYRIYMYFFLRSGWQIQFLDEDLRTALPRKLTFASPDKIIEMWERWGDEKQTEYRSSLEYAIQQGRGGIWLRLTAEERGKLTERNNN